MKNSIKDILQESFIKEAKQAVTKHRHELDMGNSSNKWGWCFTSLPDTITYYNIEQLIDDSNYQCKKWGYYG